MTASSASLTWLFFVGSVTYCMQIYLKPKTGYKTYLSLVAHLALTHREFEVGTSLRRHHPLPLRDNIVKGD